MKKAVFLDRDGVITQEPPYYAHKIDQLRLIKNAAKAIRILNQADFLVIVITNQAGIAKGFFEVEDTHNFNREMIKRLNNKGAQIDAIYFCPHHPKAIVEKYKMDCNHRKPQMGMLEKARDEYNIDLERSYLIGDKISDIKAGEKAGCKTVLVKTGQGLDEIRRGFEGVVFDNLYQSVKKILEDNI